MDKIYMCIDLKSFYASVECVERNLDPLNTNLVVCDPERTEKTICLAVSPSLKKHGIPGRARLFEVVQSVKEINYKRLKNAKNHKFNGKSYIDSELEKDKNLELDFIKAVPRMNLYKKYSNLIYSIYLKYLDKNDIYVYSIDEVFCDITHYLSYYKMKSKELSTLILKDVYNTTGITATCGVGTNLFIAKVAMDVLAKHAAPNEDGVRFDWLTTERFRKKLWNHTPLTDFWRLGRGYAKKLESYGLYTLGDICRKSIKDEDFFYKLFGVNAELLIDHAWGVEPCTIEDIKKMKPRRSSISSGQVLHCAYDYEKTKLIVQEMTDLLVLDLVKKDFITDMIVMYIGYDIDNLTNPYILNKYKGEIEIDRYGRRVPKSCRGTKRLEYKTSSTKLLMDGALELFEKIINKDLLVRRINIAFCNLSNEDSFKKQVIVKQFDLFSDSVLEEEKKSEEIKDLDKENKLQKALIDIKDKYGKNSILKGMNYLEGGTTRDRNKQVGGHRG